MHPHASPTDTSTNAETQPPDELQSVLARARGVIDIEIEALEDLKNNLNQDFLTALKLIEACPGRVIVTGMGKSGHVGKKIAATLSSTGTPAYFLHPAEGSHGDLGLITPQDVVIAISNSGDTPEIIAVLPLIKRFGVPLIAMTAKADSALAKQADAVLSIAVRQEACPHNLAPTASTTATLALGDTLAILLLERKGFSQEDFALFHPAGTLGKRLLLRVKDLMHGNPGDLPIVSLNGGFLDALVEIGAKKLGMAIVLDEHNALAGILTDGDVRRALTQYADAKSIPLEAVITRSPKMIGEEELAVSAVRLMEEHKITVLLVRPESSSPQENVVPVAGVIHLHDILKTGIR
ncbi:MAG: KpsF/GutQ family sugar-phosphate isomerase [Vampirovibrionales bacterium]|nr:KpsF/GutQ family sugar-phosphate isomerase [Vampirovibrionales bacterium]